MSQVQHIDRDASGWSASQYNTAASFVYSDVFTAPVLQLLEVKAGERVIDFGCGSGELTVKIQELVGEEGSVVGVDASESMANKALSNGVHKAFVSDIQNLNFPPHISAESFDVSALSPASFDAVFTNATLHWCKNAAPRQDGVPQGGLQGAIASAARALKPGGRFVGEMGGFMNIVGLRTAIHEVLRKRGIDPIPLDPWNFPSPEEFEQYLLSSSFRPISVTLHPRFTPLNPSSGENGLLAWLRLFARPHFFKTLDDETSEAVMREVVEMCRVDCCTKFNGRDGVKKEIWALMYVRLRFVALKN